MTQLSTHFSLEEFTTTQQRGLNNQPSATQLENLTHTAWQMELIRHILGDFPLHINSAFRSEKVNAAVGGSNTSAHTLGHACDFICPQFGTPIEIARKIASTGLKVDQLIYEHTWVHISFDPRLRQQVLTATFHQGSPTTYSVGI